MKPEYDEIFANAIFKWGKDAQLKMAIEECSELIKAICKSYRSGGGMSDEIVDEVADVTIMMRQLALMAGYIRVDERIEFKMGRLKDRVENAK
jgi:NTP pyrophosphatase (non-canonical NTP hydrolase)